jgi:hypothetical protein
MRGRFALTVTTVVVVGAALSACSSSAKSATTTTPTLASTTTAPTTTSTVRSLTVQITKKWEGAQLDTVGTNTKPTALLSTLIVHHGTWFAEVPWGVAGKTKGNWCLGDVGTWKVLDAKSLTQFTVAYHDTHSYPPCNVGSGSVTVTGSRQQNGQTVYSIKYHYSGYPTTSGTRTVCSSVWNTPHPCGLTTGIKLPTPPTQ